MRCSPLLHKLLLPQPSPSFQPPIRTDPLPPCFLECPSPHIKITGLRGSRTSLISVQTPVHRQSPVFLSRHFSFEAFSIPFCHRGFFRRLRLRTLLFSVPISYLIRPKPALPFLDDTRKTQCAPLPALQYPPLIVQVVSREKPSTITPLASHESTRPTTLFFCPPEQAPFPNPFIPPPPPSPPSCAHHLQPRPVRPSRRDFP